MAFPWLINGGDPNHLLSGMILQACLFVGSVLMFFLSLMRDNPPTDLGLIR